jgi:hypothetical protein
MPRLSIRNWSLPSRQLQQPAPQMQRRTCANSVKPTTQETEMPMQTQAKKMAMAAKRPPMRSSWSVPAPWRQSKALAPRSAEEAKKALKELRHKKREFSWVKRSLLRQKKVAELTLSAAACNRGITSDQPEPSAKSPCASTTFYCLGRGLRESRMRQKRACPRGSRQTQESPPIHAGVSSSVRSAAAGSRAVAGHAVHSRGRPPCCYCS